MYCCVLAFESVIIRPRRTITSVSSEHSFDRLFSFVLLRINVYFVSSYCRPYSRRYNEPLHLAVSPSPPGCFAYRRSVSDRVRISLSPIYRTLPDLRRSLMDTSGLMSAPLSAAHPPTPHPAHDKLSTPPPAIVLMHPIHAMCAMFLLYELRCACR